MKLVEIWNLDYWVVLDFLADRNVKTKTETGAYIRMSQVSVNDLPLEEQLLVNNKLFQSEMLNTKDLPQEQRLKEGRDNIFKLDYQLEEIYNRIIYYKNKCKFVELQNVWNH